MLLRACAVTGGSTHPPAPADTGRGEHPPKLRAATAAAFQWNPQKEFRRCLPHVTFALSLLRLLCAIDDTPCHHLGGIELLAHLHRCPPLLPKVSSSFARRRRLTVCTDSGLEFLHCGIPCVLSPGRLLKWIKALFESTYSLDVNNDD